MQLFSYVMTVDAGFAPNPFWDLCTLAACTPNHMGRGKVGDWLLGHSTKKTGNKLIYAMRISEVLDFNAYFRNERFAAKKPSGVGWREKCGDNIYYHDGDGVWKRALAFFHLTQKDFIKDTGNPRVLISDYFFYLGENSVPIPTQFRAFIWGYVGCSGYHEGKLVEKFVDWLEEKYKPSGVHGLPRDRIEEASHMPKSCRPSHRSTL